MTLTHRIPDAIALLVLSIELALVALAFVWAYHEGIRQSKLELGF